MKLLLFIAFKHIFGRKRQSFIAILSVIIACVVMTVSLAISSGLDDSMINSMLSMMPHVKAYNGVMAIDNYTQVARKIAQISGVKSATPTYESQGILQYQGLQGNFVTGVMMEGIPMSGSSTAFNLSNITVSGSATFPTMGSVIIGKQLAQNIGAQIGSVVKVISPSDQSLYLTVSGVFYSGYFDYDSRAIILPLQTMQIISQSGDVATAINVQLINPYEASKIASIIAKKTGLLTQTWGQLNYNLLYALSLERTVMILVMSLILLVSGFVVAVVLNTIVKEKTRDIGILRAYGFDQSKVLKIFMLEGIILGIIGLIIGTLLSLAILFILKHYSLPFLTKAYYLVKLPVKLTFKDFIMTTIETFVIIIVFTILPAYKASKLKVVEALKHE
ncbi:MAG: ABC transporter permease [Fusobacteria bacterium]|nr:ABC transporter permease [Fusobacteriota bacterium]